MKKLTMLAVLAAVVMVPGAARAQVVPALRLGWAVPFGDFAKADPRNDKMTDELAYQLPSVQLDLGYRLLSRLTVGGYAGYGLAKVGEFCLDGADCSARVIDLGVQATWRFALARVSPWAGAGLGWEWVHDEVADGGDTREVNARGPDVLRLMGGVDWITGERFAIGPFAQLSFGRYSYLEVLSPLGDSSGKPPDPTMHAWLTLGVRGTFETIVDQAALRRAEAARAEAAAKAEADRAAAERAAAEKAAAEKAAAEKAAADRAEAERLEAARAAAEAAAKADRDADGVPDAVDACPDEKGTSSEDAKKNGCVELVVVTAKGIDLREKIQFETGKAIIKPESEPILRSVAEVMSGHPEITRLSIEGHTDSVGAEAANVALSKRRAAAVVDWLVANGGVSPGRLTSAGYGPGRPIADNATPEGRAANRRVELLIVK